MNRIRKLVLIILLIGIIPSLIAQSLKNYTIGDILNNPTSGTDYRYEEGVSLGGISSKKGILMISSSNSYIYEIDYAGSDVFDEDFQITIKGVELKNNIKLELYSDKKYNNTYDVKAHRSQIYKAVVRNINYLVIMNTEESPHYNSIRVIITDLTVKRRIEKEEKEMKLNNF